MTKILIVEDERIVSMELESRLTNLGYTVCAQAVSGEEAINLAIEHVPDLILMDINIRGQIDGIETAKKLKEHLDIPIIFLTAFNDSKTIDRAKVIEPYGYIIKPFEERELHTTIEIGLYKHEMEKKLKASEKKQSIILKSIGDAVIAADNDGILNYMNNAAEKLTMFSREESTGKYILDIFQIENQALRNRARQIIKDQNKKYSTLNFPSQVTIKCNNNLQKIVEVNFNLIRDDDGRLNGMVLAFSDITEKFKAEIDLIESEKKYREVVENANEIIFIIDINGEFKYVNKTAIKLTGYSEAEFKRIGYNGLLLPAYRKCVNNDVLTKFLNKDKTTRIECPIVIKSGEIKWLEQNSTMIYEAGTVTGFRIIARDITDKKLAELELNTRNKFIETTLENIQVGVCVNDLNTIKFIYSNKKFSDIFGYTKNDLKTLKDLFAFNITEPELIRRIISKIKTNVKSGDFSLIRWDNIKITTQNKEEKYVSLSIIPLIDQNIVISVFQDVTYKIFAEEKILQLSRAVEQSPVCIIIASIDGKIEYVNPAFTTLTGFSLDEVKGKNPRILRYGTVKKDGYRKLWQTIKNGKDWRGEFQSIKKNGEYFWHVTTISAVKNSEGVITHFLGVIEDITERKRFENELILAKEKAEEMNKLKSNFLANMSHELRTPMIGILGYSDILINEIKDSALQEMANVINSSSNRLMQTLNLILDLSKIESNQMDVVYKNINIKSVVENEIENFRNIAKNKNLYLKAEIKNEEVISYLDEKLFIQILNNLISNSIKFTDRGGVIIEVDSEKEENTTWTVINVIDTGIGIPQNSLNLIFEEFRQVSEGYGRSYEGVGLGLTIIKKSVELMHGKISVNSTVGAGSTFTLKFPAVLRTEMDNTTEENYFNNERGKIYGGKMHKILIVDNDKMTRDFTSFILRKYFILETAVDGPSAIKLASQNKFSAILMDIGLGYGMNGIQAANEIRKINGYEETPIVAMTAYAMKGDRERFLSQGLTHYLSKPFTKDNLLDLLQNILSYKKVNQEVSTDFKVN